MGVLGGDNAGFPNGRRLGDDIVDIEEQAVAGFLKGKKVPARRRRQRERRGEPRPLPLRRSPAPGLREREGDKVRSRRSGGPLRRAPCAPATHMRNRILIARRSPRRSGDRRPLRRRLPRPHPRRLRRPRRGAGGRGLQGRLLAEREHGLARRRPPVAAAREPEGRALVRAARARLPAAGARDGRSRLVHASPKACCAARVALDAKDYARRRRARLARALPPPLPRRPRARGAGARAQPLLAPGRTA